MTILHCWSHRPLRGLILFLAVAHLGCNRLSPQRDRGWKTSDPVTKEMNRGAALMGQYKYTEAIAAFAAAAEQAPGLMPARVNLAIAHFSRYAKGDIAQAEQILDKVLSREPDNVRARYCRGLIYQHAGQNEQAASCFERVVKSAPQDGFVWYMLARSKARQGQDAEAEAKRAVKERPGLTSAYFLLMRIARQKGNDAEAQKHGEKFTALRGSPLSETVTPAYGGMGPLAFVQPSQSVTRRHVTNGSLAVGEARIVLEGSASRSFQGDGADGVVGQILSRHGVPIALADVDRDGDIDMLTAALGTDGSLRPVLLRRGDGGEHVDVTAASGLDKIANPLSYAFGDYDNDDQVDLYVCCAGANHLLRGDGKGAFEDVTVSTQTGGADVPSVSAVFLDADHDGDLDVYVCNLGANQLLNNNLDGTFTDIAAAAGVECADQHSVMLAPADMDGDRDTDLIVFGETGPPRCFANDRLGKYHARQLLDAQPQCRYGGVVQDFNGDARPDLLVLPGEGNDGQLYLTDKSGKLVSSAQFTDCVKSVATWGDVRSCRVCDIDLDGDLDVALLGEGGHVLLNDGLGRFVLRANLWRASGDEVFCGWALADLTGDGMVELIRVGGRGHGRVEVLSTELTPPANWLALTPTGSRGADRRTRSPSSGYGTKIELRAGVHRQAFVFAGLAGGIAQSHLPVVLGLNGAPGADYVGLVWPDGVAQTELTLARNAHHTVHEHERRLSSCPVLFAWNGDRFGFVSDFAGVGGLGYFIAPGRYAPPQVLEHVKIASEQLVPKNGRYEIRICEPMEEAAYVDRLELLAIDHPVGSDVYSDERLAVAGPAPTHRLLTIADPTFPLKAVSHRGVDCTERITRIDRRYAYHPPYDKRFVGFCEPHTVELDFGSKLAGLKAEDQTYLFINGWIEYPYSQTTYAAMQAHTRWQPLRIERSAGDGGWETIVADAGTPAGMGKTMTVDVTGKLVGASCRLRVTTNLEIYYDQIFVAVDRGTDQASMRTVPLVSAELRRLGYPREHSPDGAHPTGYSYQMVDAASPFRLLRGAYTRYGRVDDLLGRFDDRYVIMAPGDQIALSFDAAALAPPARGVRRSFVLVSHAYCKDMDLYTAECDTVGPLPFRAMTSYPPQEAYPDDDDHRRYRQEYNTRLVQ